MGMARKLLVIRAVRLLGPLRAGRLIRHVCHGMLLLGLGCAAWLLWTTVRGASAPIAHSPWPFELAIANTGSAENLADMHLFGVAVAGSPPVMTGADATVTGIVYASEAGASRAILVINGRQQSYAMSDTLPGGWRVADIEPGQVFLEHNGARQGLILEHKLADANADFGTQPAAIIADVAQPGVGGVSVTGGENGVIRLRALRQNLSVPPDGMTGKRVQAAARLRVTRNVHVIGRRD